MKHFVLLILIASLVVTQPCIAGQITSHTYQLGSYKINVAAIDADYGNNIIAVGTSDDGFWKLHSYKGCSYKTELGAENLRYMLILFEASNGSVATKSQKERDAMMVISGAYLRI